jgi:hypothetical protein
MNELCERGACVLLSAVWSEGINRGSHAMGRLRIPLTTGGAEMKFDLLYIYFWPIPDSILIYLR